MGRSVVGACYRFVTTTSDVCPARNCDAPSQFGYRVTQRLVLGIHDTALDGLRGQEVDAALQQLLILC